MFSNILLIIKEYMGAGLIAVIFVLSLFYLAVTEKDKAKRVCFLYVPIVILAFFLCPLSYKIYGKISEIVTYYRLLWLIPVTPVIGYSAVKICTRFTGFKQNLCIIAFAVLFAASGRLMYSDMYMVRAQNIYHMPVQVVDLCDTLHVEGREILVIMPYEFQQFVRQYDPNICMPYGREYMMNMFVGENPLRDAMMAEDKDPELVGRLATERGCHYIVVSQFEDFAEAPWNYEEFMNIDGYKIYRYVEPGPNMWPLQD
ncbi:MAG: hypothetical protein J5570_05615 [Lachnospiraceae bacterium]|nr:hypothetical protein [Lachnospiraceae bacterium]